MQLRELFEAPGKIAVTAFGRMNPPTIGHKLIADKMKSMPGDHFIFVTHTQDAKKNPLSFADKVRFAKASFGNHVTVGNEGVKTIIQMMQKLESLGYTEIMYVAGSDRVDQFEKLLNDYNGKDYNFDKITIVNAGERDPDADGAEGMSASKMRAAAVEGNFEEFKQGVADQGIAQEMYDTIRKNMGIQERELTKGEEKEKERIVKGMKKGKAGFKKRYGKDAKAVMYATATKLAKDEDIEEFIKKKELKVQQQKPKLDVLNNIAARSDGKPFPLSWHSAKGEISVGGKLYVDPKSAKQFVSFFDRNPDKQDAMTKALKSATTTAKLFDVLGLKYKLDMER